MHGRNSISISVFVFLSRFVSVFVFVSQFVSVFVSLYHLWGLVRSKGRGGCTGGTLYLYLYLYFYRDLYLYLYFYCNFYLYLHLYFIYGGWCGPRAGAVALQEHWGSVGIWLLQKLQSSTLRNQIPSHHD